MPSHPKLFSLLLLVLAGVGCRPIPSVLGTWQVLERRYQHDDSLQIEPSPEPGYYIIGDGYYGVQEIRESGPRSLFTNEPCGSHRRLGGGGGSRYPDSPKPRKPRGR